MEKLPLPSISSQYQIMPYQGCYAQDVSMIFHDAVQSIKHKCYSEPQLRAWSHQPRSVQFWDLRLRRTQSWLLLNYDSANPQQTPLCCGFINLETHFFSRGYIDCLYVHPKYQGQGFASQLFCIAQNWARSQNYAALTVDASYLSKGLFLKHGFEVKFKSYQPKSGQMLPGFFMKKALNKI